MGKYKTVDDYIADQPDEIRVLLEILKKCILTAAPDAEELFNYGIPAFALVKNGKRDQQIMIAGFKEHAGLYPNPEVLELFSERLKGFKQGKGSVQFPAGSEIPRDLIKEMVIYRKKMLEG